MILDDIIAHKRSELAAMPQHRFKSMLEQKRMSLVCELKLYSPTHPEPFVDNIQSVLDDYKKAGADAISVVTDQKYFGGSTDLVRMAKATGLPVLRKDFILNPSQITEVDCDALLLIVRIVGPRKLARLVRLCLDLGIEPVAEIHNKEELQAACATNARIIAVNSRDLQKQQINRDDGLELLCHIPDDRLKMLFSGMHGADDIRRAEDAGANGVLVGTSILASKDRQAKIHELQGGRA